MKEHWPRWVFASFSKHFATHFANTIIPPETAAYPLFVEGDDRETATQQKFSEFRLDGPRMREISNGYWELFVPVNILVQTTMNDTNVYRHRHQIGVALSGFAKSIQVFKLGAGVDDDQTQLVCMVLQGAKTDPLRINDFGQVDSTTRLQQATVEGHYKGFITE